MAGLRLEGRHHSARLQMTVPGVVVLNGERARFEIAGGNFRLIVSFSFKHQIAFVKFIGHPLGI